MRAIGIILAGGNSNRMRELSQRRAVAALPVAGSFFSIDFALSNMECSRIQKVAVLTQYNSRSLNDHLSSSKWWNFGRKQGGLYQYTPSYTNENNSWYRGTADAMAQNLSFLKEAHEPYVVIASGDCVYKMDYNKVLEYHIDKGADITVVCKDMPEDFNVERYGTIENLKMETRRYAKRQLTWFRKNKDIKWIDASKRLPDKEGSYIVFETQSGEVRESLYHPEKWLKDRCWTDPWEGCTRFIVSHWMEMPEPPEDVKHEIDRR